MYLYGVIFVHVPSSDVPPVAMHMYISHGKRRPDYSAYSSSSTDHIYAYESCCTWYGHSAPPAVLISVQINDHETAITGKRPWSRGEWDPCVEGHDARV